MTASLENKEPTSVLFKMKTGAPSAYIASTFLLAVEPDPCIHGSTLPLILSRSLYTSGALLHRLG